MALKQNTWTLNQWYDQDVAGNVSYSGENTLWSWGQNEKGELGHNNETDRSSPTQVGSDTNWALVSRHGEYAGFNSFATKTDGTLWSWGENDYGILGQNSPSNSNLSSPTQVGTGTDWPTSGVGKLSKKNAFQAIKTDGTLWSWGYGLQGQNGQNNQTAYSSPVQVGSGTDWSVIGGARNAVLAIKTDGSLWSWGDNYAGTLGQNNANPARRSSPIQIPGTWSAVDKGGVSSALATKTDGTLWCWGENNEGEARGILGQNNQTSYSSPVQVGSATDWDTGADKISVNKHAAIAIKTDGTMWAWGSNQNGSLAMDSGDGGAQRSSPIQIPGTTWNTIASGSQHFLATRTDGTLWVWGINSQGRLGLNGPDASAVSPTQVPGTDWSIVAGGERSSLAIQTK